MLTTTHRRALAAALLILWPTGHGGLHAQASNYAFELVETELKQGHGAVVSVRLLDRRAGTAVPDAVIFARRLDMAPDDMASMTSPLEPLPSSDPGVYRFRTDLTMAGRWRLSLAAKVQGEVGTVEGRLVLRALP